MNYCDKIKGLCGAECTNCPFESTPHLIPEDMAEDHWQFIEKWLHMVYVDSFVHGFKHGKEDVE